MFRCTNRVDTPEACNVLELYRENWKADIGSYPKPDDPLLKSIKFPAVRRLNQKGVRKRVDNVVHDIGLRQPLPPGKRRHAVQLDHGFRKYFNTMMRRAKVDYLDKEDMMGNNKAHRAISIFVLGPPSERLHLTRKRRFVSADSTAHAPHQARSLGCGCFRFWSKPLDLTSVCSGRALRGIVPSIGLGYSVQQSRISRLRYQKRAIGFASAGEPTGLWCRTLPSN